MKRSREEEERQHKLATAKRRKMILNVLMYGCIGIGGLALVFAAISITLAIVG